MPGQEAFRSYSIAGGANGEGWQNSYTQAKRHSEIQNPSTKYVFVEESDPRGWNAGSWVLNAKTKTWVDPLAIWHNGKSTLGFADGHAEKHRWLDERTIKMAEEQNFGECHPGSPDVAYMHDGYAYRKLK